MRAWTLAGSAAVLIAAGSARAAERTDGTAAQVDLKVADDVRNGAGMFTGIGYGTSERFGRAWLVLHYQFQGSCPDADGECEMDAPVDVNVPGLTYDAAGRRVVYQDAGTEPVVCATERHRGFPWLGDSLEATGSCGFRLVKVDRLVDDGFSGRRDRRQEVHFAVRSRPADAAPGAVAGASR